jgi:hypothetical protein
MSNLQPTSAPTEETAVAALSDSELKAELIFSEPMASIMEKRVTFVVVMLP